MFKSDYERAVAYAGYKTLERALKDDGDLPAGFYQDVTGVTLSVTFPKGSVVERDRGTNGDGSMFKKATSNIYGYALWALMIVKLRRFNQWKQIREVMLDAMREVIRRRGKKTFREEIEAEHPEVVKEIEALYTDLGLPERAEETPRLFKETGLPATMTITGPHRASVA